MLLKYIIVKVWKRKHSVKNQISESMSPPPLCRFELAGRDVGGGAAEDCFPHFGHPVPARLRARSRPSAGSFSVLMADTRGQGLETVAACSPSPALSCSNSTKSLLSPLRHQSFPFDDDDGNGEVEEDGRKCP